MPTLSMVPRGLSLIVIILTSSLSSSLAQAGTYGYFPNSPLYLGGNFDPTSLNEPRLPCVQYKMEVQRERYRGPDNGALGGGGTVTPRQTQFDISQVKSRESLYKYLNISAAISGSYGFFSGSASFEFESENTFNADSFTWIIRAYTKFGEFGVDDSVSLNPVSIELLNRRGRTAFEARCGTEYVGQVTRGALVAAVYTVKNVAQSDMQRLEAQFKASYDTGFWDVGGGAKYKSFFSYAKQVGTIEVHVYALGGNGITALSDAAVATDDIDKIRLTFKNYLDSLTVDKSAVTELLTGSLKQFSPRLPDVVLDTYNRRIGELWLAREDFAAQRRRLMAFLRASSDYDLAPADIKAFKDRAKALSESVNEIEKTARKCRLTSQTVKLRALVGDLQVRNTNQMPQTKADAEIYPVQQQMDLYAVANGADVEIRLSDGVDRRISDECPFEIPELAMEAELLPPPYPFAIETWTDTFGTAPKKFLFAILRSSKLAQVKVMDGNVPAATLATPPVVTSGATKEAVIMLELDDGLKFPLVAVATMQSGRDYPSLLLNVMPR